MADFVKSNSLIATNEVGQTTSPPLRGSAEWLTALSEEVTHDLSDSLARQKKAKKMATVALLELDAVIGNMQSHTRLSNSTRRLNTQSVSTQPTNTQSADTQSADTQLANTQSANTQSADTQLAGSRPTSAFKPSALAAYGLGVIAEEVPVSESAQLPEPQSCDVADSVRASWPVNWSVLRVPEFQVPRLKASGGNSPSPSI